MNASRQFWRRGRRTLVTFSREDSIGSICMETLMRIFEFKTSDGRVICHFFDGDANEAARAFAPLTLIGEIFGAEHGPAGFAATSSGAGSINDIAALLAARQDDVIAWLTAQGYVIAPAASASSPAGAALSDGRAS
jgi:hypothetical protein